MAWTLTNAVSNRRVEGIEAKLEQWALRAGPSYPKNEAALLLSLAQLVQVKKELEEDVVVNALRAEGLIALGDGDNIEFVGH